MFRRLAVNCYQRRRLVLATWVVLLIGLLIIGKVAGGKPATDFKLPGSETQQAFDLLKTKGFGTRTGQQTEIVLKADQGVTDPAVKQAMEAFFATILQEIPGTSIVSPYQPEGARQVAPGGKIAYAELDFADRRIEDYIPLAKQIKAERDKVQVAGLDVELGGDIFITQAQSPSEIIGALGAVIILLIAFGSLLAMGLPLITAGFGIGTGIALGQLAANFLKMPSFTSQLTLMIGLGVGIDYALFIVTRYRQGLAEGRSPAEAIERSLDTSGRAVLFAGTTVVISLLGMFAMNLEFMRSLAIAASLGVLMTMLASLTLLPAMLGFVGHNIDRFGLPHRAQVGEANAAASFWYRWSRLIQGHPWPALIGGLALLIVLAIPLASIRFGFADAGTRPTTDTTRRAYDLLAEGFGPGFNGAILVVADSPSGKADPAVLQRLDDQIRGTANVAFVSPPIPNQAGDAAIIQVYPKTAPQEKATSDLIKDLRSHVIPAAVDGANLEVKVGGLTPGALDFANYTLHRLPLVMGSVLVLSFLLLMAVFRSLVVPLKAVIMNLLSIGAAYGVIVAIFQWGWLKSVIGINKSGPIEAWVPLMLYAIVFGLSMDYEVFLLSRIREEYDRTHRNAEAVADGLAVTARVITAAAAIMVCVFMSFVLGPDRSIKLFGLGLAAAVFIDATVVRLILVPAAMELLGDANWWLPRWLSRLLPQIHVDALPDSEAVPARS